MTPLDYIRMRRAILEGVAAELRAVEEHFVEQAGDGPPAPVGAPPARGVLPERNGRPPAGPGAGPETPPPAARPKRKYTRRAKPADETEPAAEGPAGGGKAGAWSRRELTPEQHLDRRRRIAAAMASGSVPLDDVADVAGLPRNYVSKCVYANGPLAATSKQLFVRTENGWGLTPRGRESLLNSGSAGTAA